MLEQLELQSVGDSVHSPLLPVAVTQTKRGAQRGVDGTLNAVASGVHTIIRNRIPQAEKISNKRKSVPKSSNDPPQNTSETWTDDDAEDGIEDDIRHYVRTACSEELLTAEGEKTIAEDIHRHHQAWSSAFFRVPALQTMSRSLLQMLHTGQNRRTVFDSPLESDKAKEILARIDTLLSVWNTKSVAERSATLGTIGINKLWMSAVHRAACTVYEAAQTRSENVDDVQDDNDDIHVSEQMQKNTQCRGLLQVMGTLSASEILAALDGISTAETSYQGWVKAKKSLCHGNTRLCMSIARGYQNNGLPLLDLIQEGNTGLMRAAELFNLEHGVKFSDYAPYWINQAIQRALDNTSRIVRRESNMYETWAGISAMRQKLRQENNGEPTDDEVASALSMDVKMIWDLERQCTSIDPYVGPEDEILGKIILEDYGTPSSPAAAHTHEIRDAIRRVLNMLADKERSVLTLLYGLGDGYFYTMGEAAEELNMTRQGVRKIEKRALKKLQDPELARHLHSFLDDKKGEDVDV